MPILRSGTAERKLAALGLAQWNDAAWELTSARSKLLRRLDDCEKIESRGGRGWGI